MPIDKMISDSMLGTFRNMVQECRDRKLSGPSFDKMAAELAKMEKYAQEIDDVAAFSAKLTTENCFLNFSTYYGEVLADASKQSTSTGDEDAGLLRQTLQAYTSALSSYDQQVSSGTMKPAEAVVLKKAVQDVMDLGQSGVSYPVFLRQLIEKGLDRALEGSVAARQGLVTDLEWTTFANRSLEVRMREEILSAFDEMASAASFGIPDSFLFGLKRQRIEWSYAPDMAKWSAIWNRCDYILTLVNDWIDAYTKFAPTDDRWLDKTNPSRTKKNIRRTQQLNPHRLAFRELLLKQSFGLSWDDIFNHETYLEAFANVDIVLTQAKIDLLKKTHSHCAPGGEPPRELIVQAEQLIDSGTNYRSEERKGVAQKMIARYDQSYGDGAYQRTFVKS